MHTLLVTKMVNSPSYIDRLVILDDRCSCFAFSNVMFIMAKICYRLLVDNTGSFLSSGVRRRRLFKCVRPYVCSSVDAFVNSTRLLFLKLCMCFVHGLKMCMWFGHYRQIIIFSPLF